MKHESANAPAGNVRTTADAGLPGAERSELQRQGAKAAARGEAADVNPLAQPRNRPPATGESLARWWQRFQAWEQGHRLQSIVRGRGRSRAARGGGLP